MNNQPRQPKGAPGAGQWASEPIRAGAAASNGASTNGVTSEKFNPPAPGGYDELLVHDHGLTEYRYKGQLHREDGAARLDPLQKPEYYLSGEQVEQYEVFRKMAPDPERFDQLYDEGAERTLDAVKGAVGDVLRFGAMVSSMSDLRPDDRYMKSAPDLAAQACAAADVADDLKAALRDRYRTHPHVDPEINELAAIESIMGDRAK